MYFMKHLDQVTMERAMYRSATLSRAYNNNKFIIITNYTTTTNNNGAISSKAKEESAQFFPNDPSGKPPISSCLSPCSLALSMHYSLDSAQHMI